MINLRQMFVGFSRASLPAVPQQGRQKLDPPLVRCPDESQLQTFYGFVEQHVVRAYESQVAAVTPAREERELFIIRMAGRLEDHLLRVAEEETGAALEREPNRHRALVEKLISDGKLTVPEIAQFEKPSLYSIACEIASQVDQVDRPTLYNRLPSVGPIMDAIISYDLRNRSEETFEAEVLSCYPYHVYGDVHCCLQAAAEEVLRAGSASEVRQDWSTLRHRAVRLMGV